MRTQLSVGRSVLRSAVHLIHAYLILTILAPFPVWAAVGTAGVDNWFVKAGCTFNGDGLGSGCAASDGASGAWNDPANIIWTAITGVDASDIVKICGIHVQKFLTVGSSVSAPIGSEIVIDWDCDGDPGLMTNRYTLTTATTAGNWTDAGSNKWYIDVNSLTWDDPNRLWKNGVELLGSDTLGNLCTNINGGTPVSEWYHDGALGRLYLCSVGNPAIGLTSLVGLFGVGANDYAPVRINGGSIAGIKLKNPKIEGGALASIYTLGPKRITIYGTTVDRQNCVIGKYSARTILLQGTSTSGTGSNNEDIHIYNCTIDQEWPSHLGGYKFELTYRYGNVIEVAGSTRPVIRNNTIKDGSHAGLYMLSIGGTDTVVDGLVEYNSFSCSPWQAYCRLLDIDEDTLDRASRNVVQMNWFTDFSVRMQFNGSHNFLLGNMIGNVRPDIVVKGGTSADKNQSISREKYAGSTQDNTIAGNSFFNNPYAPCVDYRNSGLSITGDKWYNNIFDHCGSPTYVTTAAQDAAVYIPAGFTGTMEWKNNLFFPTTPNPVSYKGIKYTGVTFQASCSGGDQCSGNVAADPLFVSQEDMRTRGLSPARNAGLPTPLCRDVRGTPCGPIPTIGALQPRGGDPAAPRTAR